MSAEVATAGYLLAQKLGLKNGQRVLFVAGALAILLALLASPSNADERSGEHAIKYRSELNGCWGRISYNNFTFCFDGKHVLDMSWIRHMDALNLEGLESTARYRVSMGRLIMDGQGTGDPWPWDRRYVSCNAMMGASLLTLTDCEGWGALYDSDPSRHKLEGISFSKAQN